MFSKIAVVDIVNLDESSKNEILTFSKSPLIFPETDSKDVNEYIKRIGNADCVIGSWKTTIDKRILDSCPNIKFIAICGTSLANINIDEVKKRNISLKNVTDYGDEATAEYIFSKLLMLIRGFDNVKQNESTELNGKTLGLIGLGAVGSHVARLGLGFNMNVVYTSKSRKPEWEQKGLHYLELNDLLKESDFISLHVPKNNVVLNSEQFDLIKPGAVLVDTCLGIVFDVVAFKAWINKKVNYAIFDLKPELYDKLKDFPNCIGLNGVTAGRTIESRTRLSKKVIRNLKDFLQLSK